MNTKIYEEMLIQKRDEILERLDRIDHERKRKDGALEADSEEQAISLQNDEVVDKLDNIERAEVEKIFAALERIKNGTYGVCFSCEEPIGENRLKAVPYATQCMNCLNDDSN